MNNNNKIIDVTIQRKILNYIDRNQDYTPLRTVCKDWKNHIDATRYFQFQIHHQQYSPLLKFLSTIIDTTIPFSFDKNGLFISTYKTMLSEVFIYVNIHQQHNLNKNTIWLENQNYKVVLDSNKLTKAFYLTKDEEEVILSFWQNAYHVKLSNSNLEFILKQNVKNQQIENNNILSSILSSCTASFAEFYIPAFNNHEIKNYYEYQDKIIWYADQLVAYLQIMDCQVYYRKMEDGIYHWVSDILPDCCLHKIHQFSNTKIYYLLENLSVCKLGPIQPTIKFSYDDKIMVMELKSEQGWHMRFVFHNEIHKKITWIV